MAKTIEEAMHIFKEHFPKANNYDVYEFRGQYVFDAGANRKYVIKKGDDRVLMPNISEFFDNLDELGEARKNGIHVKEA